MRLLYVNDSLVDLADNQVVALTKQSNNLFDFQNKRSNLSNTLRLPKSDANNLIFGNANDLSSTAIQRNWYTVKYIQEYEEIISYGRGKLVSALGNFYEFIIYWGNIDLVARLGDKTLRDLDLSDLLHTWNLANVKSLSLFSGDVIYPILNTHETEELRAGTVVEPLYAARILPMVSLKRILKQIEIDNDIEFIGNIEGDFIDITDIAEDRYIAPVTKKYLNVEDVNQIITANRLLSNNTQNPFTEADVLFTEGTVIEEITVEESGTYKYAFNTINRFVFTTTSIAGSIQMNINVIIAIETYDEPSGLWANAYLLGDTTKYQQFNNTETVNGTGITTIGLNEDATFRLYFTAGTRIRFSVIANISIVPSGSSLSFTTFNVQQYIQQNSNITFIPQPIEFGDQWPVESTLPEIAQIDLIKYVAAKKCYLIDTEDGTNQVRFVKFSEIVNSVTQSENISDITESVEITNYHCPLAQENLLHYDNSKTGEPDGEGFIIIEDNTLQPKAEFYIAPFAASKNEVWNSILIGRFPAIKAWNEDLEEVGNRIYKLKYETFTALYIIADVTSQSVTEKYIAYWDSVDNFDSIVDAEYEDYSEVMNNYLGVDAVLNLSANLFKTIDLLRTAYIEHFGAYFLIKIVPDFVEGKKVTVELIKL